MKQKKVLAISSGGGHWVQLQRLRPSLDGCDVVFLTVDHAYQEEVEGHRFYKIPDATRWNKARLIFMSLRILIILLRERPDIIITTGAAPGYVAIRLGKLLGAKTIWIDSIANAEILSGSGSKIGRHTDLWLTQWEHLATHDGPLYRGKVL